MDAGSFSPPKAVLPAFSSSSPPRRREQRPFESWAELDAVAANLSPRYRPTVMFAAATGLRPAEWLALEWQVDVETANSRPPRQQTASKQEERRSPLTDSKPSTPLLCPSHPRYSGAEGQDVAFWWECVTGGLAGRGVHLSMATNGRGGAAGDGGEAA